MTNVRKQSENARNLSRKQSVSGGAVCRISEIIEKLHEFLALFEKVFRACPDFGHHFSKITSLLFFILFLILKLPQTIDRFFMIFLCFQGSKWALLLLDLLLKKIKKQLPPVVLKNSYFFHVFCKKVIFFSIQGGQC